MRVKILVVGLTCLFMSLPAYAGFLSGSMLYGRLAKDQQGEKNYPAGVAAGYVVGVFDATEGVLFCAPKDKGGVSVLQVKQVVFNYMKAHPKQWNYSARNSVVAALRATWPCKDHKSDQ